MFIRFLELLASDLTVGNTVKKTVDITIELLFSKANMILFVVLVVDVLNRLAIKCLCFIYTHVPYTELYSLFLIYQFNNVIFYEYVLYISNISHIHDQVNN